MNYKLENFEIVIAEGNRISGQETGNKYLRCKAVNPFNRFEPSHNVVIFDEGTVKYYEALLPKGRGGLLPDEGWDERNMKNEDKIFANAMTVEFDLGGEYCRKYTADIIDANGNPIQGKHKGDYIRNQAGYIKRFRKIEVFVQYDFERETIYDESGFPAIDEKTGMPKMRVARNADGTPKTYWVQNWSPSFVGERMRALLTPYDAAASAADVAQAPHTPEPNSASSVFEEEPDPAQQQTQQQTQTA